MQLAISNTPPSFGATAVKLWALARLINSRAYFFLKFSGYD
jgi:hypothetical protein